MTSKPLYPPALQIQPLTYHQFGTMAFRNRRVFLRDYSSSLAFFERLLADSGDRLDPGENIGGALKALTNLRRGKHTFISEQDFIHAVAHEFGVILATLTHQYPNSNSHENQN